MAPDIGSFTELTAVVIGEGLLPLQCADRLQKKGIAVVGVVSSTDDLRAWADTRGIARIEDGEDLLAFLSRQPFDLLFSIVNSRVLTADALALPRRGAVNFHNALLPRYAGRHASSWAILEQAPAHGVTWHAMTPRVDGGDILTQAAVPIDASDTAHTLDLKCYERGLTAFDELIANLPGLLDSGTKQDVTQRTFYPAARKPPGAGIISWCSGADEIDRLVRALTVSPQTNAFASPLVALGDRYYIVTHLEVLDDRSLQNPGTLLHHSASGVRVATSTHDVRVSGLRTMDGDVVDIDALVDRIGLTSGSLLPSVGTDVTDGIARAFRHVAPREAFWVSRLQSLAPLRLPSATPANMGVDAPARVTASIECQDIHTAVSALLAFLGRMANTWSFDVGFCDCRGGAASAWQERFFAPYLPLRCDIDPSWSVEQTEAHILDRMHQLAVTGTFARDLGGRYAALRRTGEGPAWALPVVVSVGAGSTLPSWTPGSQLVIDLSLERNAVTWWFDPRVLPKDVVGGLARGYTAFLNDVRTSPATTVGRVQAVDRATLRHLCEARLAPYPRNACLHELFEEQAAQTPDTIAVALHRGNRTLTYRELNAQANRLAHALREKGVRTSTPVAVVLDRSVECLIAIVGILKAGGTYVPLDPAWPPHRLRTLLDDFDPRLVLTSEQMATAPALVGRSVLCVDGESPFFAAHPSTNLQPRCTATDLAAVLFTSGSTGQSKGVAIPHRAVVRLVMGTDYVPWAESLTFLQLAPISFDASFLEIWGPLLHGGRCVVFTDRLPDLGALGRALDEHQVRALWLTASLFNLVIDQQPQILRGVCYLLTGGEALSVGHVRRALDALPGTRLINGYGPTEGTTFTCCYSIPTALAADASSVPIGRPLANTRVYVLDGEQKLVPLGVPGELYIGGDGVAQGYWRRPDLTAERFLPDPFVAVPQARMYRSGDRGRWLPDGTLEFLGRLDDQVKIRGFRVEPGEVEAVLGRHPAVRQCAVLVHQHGGVSQLVSYVVPRAGAPAHEDLRRYLADRLPVYIIPAAFVTLDALPLTRSGKIDRAALPAPLPRHRDDVMALATPMETAIATIWCGVLAVPSVGLDDNFFDLGGDSLGLMQMQNRLAVDLHVDLSVTDSFQYPTVRTLAHHLGHEDGPALAPAAAERARRQRQAFARQRHRRP